jgi:uncharacterized protein (TIGR03790 family)
MRRIKMQIAKCQNSDQRTSMDSELALVLKEPYPLSGRQPNPYYLANQNKTNFAKRIDTLMVSRLDGPEPQTVKRIIDDSFNSEKNGLNGIAYFDAMWSMWMHFPGNPVPSGTYIASSECSTLKKEGSRVWCKMMLEKGAAATLGPVGEPYI